MNMKFLEVNGTNMQLKQAPHPIKGKDLPFQLLLYCFQEVNQQSLE